MKKEPSKDMIIILVLTILSTIGLVAMDLGRYQIIPYILLMFILPGFSFIMAICPLKKDLSRKNRFFLSSEATVLIGILFFIVSGHNPLQIESTIVFLIMAILTIFLALATFFERRIFKENNTDEATDKSDEKKVVDNENESIEASEEKYNDEEEEKYSSNNEEEQYPDNNEEQYLDKDYGEEEKDQMDLDKRNVDKKSKKRFIPTNLILMFLVAVLCMIFVLTPRLNDTFVKTILELFVILFIPGYSLIAALFPRKDDLEDIERTALSFGLSVTITPLIGLALHYTTGSISLTPLSLLLSALTFIMIFVALLRIIKVPPEERFTVPFRRSKNCEGESKSSKILSILLIITIVLAILTTVYIVLNPNQGQKFTEFYILEPNGTTNYPTNLTVGKNGSVVIGIVNHENMPVNYQLVVTSNGKIITQQNVMVDNAQNLEIPYNFTVGSAGTKDIEFMLYKLPDQTNAYRSTHLVINVTS